MKRLLIIVAVLWSAQAVAQCTVSAETGGLKQGVGIEQCSQGITVSGPENLYCTKGSGVEQTEGTATWGSLDGIAALPSKCIYTGSDATPSHGTTTTVADSAALTTALANSSCGDTIVLNAGTVYTGPFTLPFKSCDGNHWVIIRSSGTTDPLFPPEGIRITPCAAGISNDAVNGRNLPGYPDYACSYYPTVLMAHVKQGPGANDPIFSFSSGANHYRFVGLDMLKDPTHAANALVSMAADGQTLGANHIIFDRSIIRGDQWTPASLPVNESQNGIQAKNSQWVSVVNSWIYDTYCTSSCVDSHDFGAGTGLFQDGPFKLYNNLLATAAESWMFGGGGQGTGTPNSSDVEIRNNFSMKPLTWMVPINSCKDYRQAITKNLGELKNLVNGLFEGNVFQNSWQGCQSDQSGYAFLFNPTNQNLQQAMTVNFDGSNLVTAADSHSFTHHNAQSALSGNPIDAANCPPGGCILEDTVNNVKYRFCNSVNGCDQSGVPNLQCGTATPQGSVAGTACTTDAQCPGSYCAPTTVARLTTAPPAQSNVNANSCVPGDCPSCRNKNITFRFNEVYNTTNGINFNTGLSSHCQDQGAGLSNISVHDNLLRAVDRNMTNGVDPDSGPLAFQLSSNSLPPSVQGFVDIVHNTVVISQGNQNGSSGFGNQIDRSDSQYLQGFNIHDNVSPAAWNVSRGTGTGVTKGIGGNPGLANTYAVNSCQRYFTAEIPTGTVPSAPFVPPQDFTFAGVSLAGTNYLVSLNGQYTAITGQTPTSFHVTATVKNGDTINVRDLDDCQWSFYSNVLGKGTSQFFKGAGLDRSPYPNQNSCGAGNSQNCILDESAAAGSFVNNFVNWYGGREIGGRDGNYAIASNSPFYHTASDALTRASTGQSPGADLTALSQLTSGVAGTIYVPTLTVTTTRLPGATQGLAYNAFLTASYGASQFWNGYKSWYLETDSTKCLGDCGSVDNGSVHSGIIVDRGGIVNGPLSIQSISRTGCPSTCLSNYTVEPTIVAGAWEVGQTVSMANFANGTTTANANDSTFNGTCVISAIGTNSYSCPMTNGYAQNVAGHVPNGPKTCGISGTAQCDSTVSFAPLNAGTYGFWMTARDGAFQLARGRITVTVTAGSTQEVLRPTTETSTTNASLSCPPGNTQLSTSLSNAYDASGLATSSQLAATGTTSQSQANARLLTTWQSTVNTYTNLTLNVNAQSTANGPTNSPAYACIRYSTNGGTSYSDVACDSTASGFAQQTYTIMLNPSQVLSQLRVGVCAWGDKAGLDQTPGTGRMTVWDVWTSGTH